MNKFHLGCQSVSQLVMFCKGHVVLHCFIYFQFVQFGTHIMETCSTVFPAICGQNEPVIHYSLFIHSNWIVIFECKIWFISPKPNFNLHFYSQEEAWSEYRCLSLYFKLVWLILLNLHGLLKIFWLQLLYSFFLLVRIAPVAVNLNRIFCWNRSVC